MSESEKERFSDGESTQQEQYRQHLQQQSEQEEDEGYGDTDTGYVPSGLRGDTAFSPASPSPSPSPERLFDGDAPEEYDPRAWGNTAPDYNQGSSGNNISTTGDGENRMFQRQIQEADALPQDGGTESYSGDNAIDLAGDKETGNYEADVSPEKRSLGGDSTQKEGSRHTGQTDMIPDNAVGSTGWAGDGYLDGYSEDQKQALTELQQMRLDLDYPGNPWSRIIKAEHSQHFQGVVAAGAILHACLRLNPYRVRGVYVHSSFSKAKWIALSSRKCVNKCSARVDPGE